VIADTGFRFGVLGLFLAGNRRLVAILLGLREAIIRRPPDRSLIVMEIDERWRNGFREKGATDKVCRPQVRMVR
jgi:hypothetical protein